tara:strand:- start:1081 stop:1482 length:402 start_codon:yes stop_codon:yes gene_type:complete
VFGELKLVNCNISYWNFVRKIRNENQGFITYAKISIYTQILYMFKHAKNYKICIDGEQPVGFIGNVNNDLRFAVHKNFRRKGIGKYMLSNFNTCQETIGKVNIENIGSRKLFEACGWKENNKIGQFIFYKNER